jgi:hypothetical protein
VQPGLSFKETRGALHGDGMGSSPRMSHSAAVHKASNGGSMPKFRQMGVSFSPSVAYGSGYGNMHMPAMMGMHAGAKAFAGVTNRFMKGPVNNAREHHAYQPSKKPSLNAQQFAEEFVHTNGVVTPAGIDVLRGRNVQLPKHAKTNTKNDLTNERSKMSKQTHNMTLPKDLSLASSDTSLDAHSISDTNSYVNTGVANTGTLKTVIKEANVVGTPQISGQRIESTSLKKSSQAITIPRKDTSSPVSNTDMHSSRLENAAKGKLPPGFSTLHAMRLGNALPAKIPRKSASAASVEMPSQEELLRAFHGAAPPLTERGNINYNNPPMSMANLNEQMRNTNKIIVQQEGHKPSKFNLMALQQARDQNPI